MARLVNRRRSAKKSLRKKNMRKSVKHTKRNNRKTRMSHKRHTRKQRGGISKELFTQQCKMKCIEKLVAGVTPAEGFRLPAGVNMGKYCDSECNLKWEERKSKKDGKT